MAFPWQKHGLRARSEPVSSEVGFAMNALGLADDAGSFRGSSVYQKPLCDAEKDWMPLDESEALAIMTRYGRVPPTEQIAVLKRKIEDIDLVVRERMVG